MWRNADVPWGQFDAESYFDHYYSESTVRDDERFVIERARDFFSSADLGPDACGIDVGTGSNLYPALLLLGICSQVTLFEFSPSNIAWLEKELHTPAASWQGYWDVLASDPGYRLLDDPWRLLRERVEIIQGSVFAPPRRKWDAGTMFYVAESVTSDEEEFEQGLTSFVSFLKSGAPFAIAFMENSFGYSVGANTYPAVLVDKERVEAIMRSLAKNITVERVGIIDTPLREGYSGLVLVTGNAPPVTM